MKKKNLIRLVSYLVALLAIVLLCGAARSCTCCSLEGCPGGLYVSISLEGEDTFPDGTYDFYIEVDNINYQEQCIVKNYPEETDCTLNALEQFGGDEPRLWAQLDFYKTENTIDFHAEFWVDGEGGSIAGPEYVSIRVELDGVVVGEEEWWPEYVRDHEFWGDEDCGYCDLAVEEEMALSITY